MKLKIRKEQAKTRVDANRQLRLNASLTKLSTRKKLEEIAPPAAAKPVPVLPPGTKVTVNISGNRRGMHVAGDSEHMKKVRAMRRIYNKQMPVLACSNCAFQNTCPQFKAGYECAFLPFFNSHKIESESDIIEGMKELLSAGMRRAHQTLTMETLSGATPSLENTESINLLFQQFSKFYEITADKQNVTLETEDSTIIGRLFGGLDNLVDHTKKAKEDNVEALPLPMIEDTKPLISELETLTGGVDTDLVRDHARNEIAPILNEQKDENGN